MCIAAWCFKPYMSRGYLSSGININTPPIIQSTDGDFVPSLINWCKYAGRASTCAPRLFQERGESVVVLHSTFVLPKDIYMHVYAEIKQTVVRAVWLSPVEMSDCTAVRICHKGIFQFVYSYYFNSATVFTFYKRNIRRTCKFSRGLKYRYPK